ncbi:hypothetical protein HMPREF2887_05705 [Streptococcus sp. HMSC071H03]|uniref:YopX family protein n=1 Tax=Streptococcus sp. HMSC071H03 TaxID=1739391 RepID=UPI0008AAAD0F|nr:YopX family protein [Streptococcus sp. HMSC071H03]OFR41652.1 hypothetical protein HMPREF2887_05705 [Streptococcus sp. HMSC071H03]
MIPKFRAWDKTHKKLGLIDADMLGGYFQSVKIFDEDEDDWQEPENFILMQSTGLKDKNGKEIFEGDIIATNSFACIVSFGKYDYFEDDGIKITGIGFYLEYLNVEPATYSPFESPFLENCEVLGNIHENMLDLIMFEKWKSENWELMEGKK